MTRPTVLGGGAPTPQIVSYFKYPNNLPYIYLYYSSVKKGCSLCRENPYSSMTQVIYFRLLIFFWVERAGPYLTLGFDGACGLGWGGQTRAKVSSCPLIISYLLLIPILYLNPKYPSKPVSVSVYGKHTYCCDR